MSKVNARRPAATRASAKHTSSPAKRRDQSSEAHGKSLRKRVPRSAHGVYKPSRRRRDPVEMLKESSRDRVRHLVPIRYGRMLQSPFAFFRGGAAIMAADLARTPATGLHAQV